MRCSLMQGAAGSLRSCRCIDSAWLFVRVGPQMRTQLRQLHQMQAVVISCKNAVSLRTKLVFVCLCASADVYMLLTGNRAIGSPRNMANQARTGVYRMPRGGGTWTLLRGKVRLSQTVFQNKNGSTGPCDGFLQGLSKMHTCLRLQQSFSHTLCLAWRSTHSIPCSCWAVNYTLAAGILELVAVVLTSTA